MKLIVFNKNINFLLNFEEDTFSAKKTTYVLFSLVYGSSSVNYLWISCLQGSAKSSPLKFFAIFSATIWNFNSKFYSFIY